MSVISKSSADSLLRMTGVTKRFGATCALNNVQLDVKAGEVLALIGENGAGKSTLMKILSGALSADQGDIRLAGKPLKAANPHEARTRGVAMIYQELNLAPDLSVQDNIMLGQERQRFGVLNRASQRKKVLAALDMLGHPELRPDVPVDELSVGAQQLVEIARALVMDARLIIFDEPTSSLASHDIRRLFDVIRTLKQRQLGIVYISHFLEEVREICDRYTVLRDGEYIGSGALRDVSGEEIVALMVGRSVDELFPTVPHTPGEPILSLDRLCGRDMPVNVDLELRRGEILGIAGLVGAGRSELLRAIYGLDAVTRGRISVAGNSPGRNPRAQIRAGLGFVSEDRKTEGLAQVRSIADNLTLSRLGPYSRFGWLNLRRRHRAVEERIVQMQVKATSPDQAVQALSGGNQQKVAIARVLHQEADILLLDEPTRGIDVGTKSEIYRLVGQLAASGKAILFVSSYLPELMAVCDRIGVMARGRLTEIRETGQWTEEQIITCAISVEEE